MRKTDVLETCRKSKFLGKKIWRNALALKSKKVQGIFGETFILALLSSAVFCFAPEIKRFLLEFLRKLGWFQGHYERFHKYLGQKLKFLKTETRFWRWKGTDNSDINIFLSLKNPCTWKRIFNTNSELSQNRTEKQIIPSKATVNWLFNEILCYLFIGCFDWKTDVFQ